MYKDQKLNKSPIESILQQSFSQKPHSLGLNHNHQQFLSQKNNIHDDHEHSQFKISYQAPNINIQQKLKIMQMMSMVQLQISIQNIVSILNNKVLTKSHFAWIKIKKADINKNAAPIIHKTDKLIFIKKINLFCQKINSVLLLKKLRNLGTSFNQILIHNKSNFTEKSSSIVSPYKIKSKIDHSQRGDSQWQLAHSQGYPDNEHLTRQNRFLKKKKQKIKAHREEFCTKIDEILSFHEGFLSKK